MAVTDDQLRKITAIAERLGRESKGGPPDTRDDVVHSAFAEARAGGMRTEDAHDAPIDPMDLPAPEDWADLYEAYQRGRTAPLETPGGAS